MRLKAITVACITITCCHATPTYPAEMQYCSQWAQDYVKFLESRAYSYCLVREVDKLSVPSNEDWINVMNRLNTADIGTVPAGDDPTPKPINVEACKKEYRTFRSSDNTVIRFGSKGKRVPCPL